MRIPNSRVVGALVYIGAAFVVVESGPARPLVLFYAVMITVFVIAVHGFMIGHLRGNGVRVSAAQFGSLNNMVAANAATLQLAKVPDVFVLQAGGVLNAFATHFIGRNFVVLYSDVLAAAGEQGEAAVSFIVGHELAHLKRRHLTFRWLLLPSRFVPFLNSAYSRACEYTCDQFGAVCAPDGAVSGLLVLAAGRKLYRQVNARLFAAQAESEAGFWTTIAEIFASHPHLTKRVAAVLRAGVAVPAYSPVITTVEGFAQRST